MTTSQMLTKEIGNFKFIHWILLFMQLSLFSKKSTKLKDPIGRTFIDRQDKIIMTTQEQSMKLLIFLTGNKLRSIEIKYKRKLVLEEFLLKWSPKSGSRECKQNHPMFIREPPKFDYIF